ncbi:MAG: hypothetical protein KGY70_16280 [Bacteroidales bacterium]|nr:hypothetical protein [Bacteroidales bacterium]
MTTTRETQRIQNLTEFLKEAKRLSDKNTRFSYAKLSSQHKVDHRHFLTALTLWYFERTKRRGYYKCKVDHIEPFHARQIMAEEKNKGKRTGQNEREPLTEYSIDELLDELKRRGVKIDGNIWVPKQF